jgi:hypothetical protein
MYITIKWFTK